MKDSLWKNFLAGGLGGLILVFAVLPLAVRFNILGSAALLDKVRPPKVEVTKIEKEVSINFEKRSEEIIKKAGDSIVAIKSYKSGLLLRFGSGVAVTQDGLIITANQVVPADATSYQIVTDNKIFTGKIVWRDWARNLALLKISENSLRPISFSAREPAVGSELLAVGKLAQFQEAKIFSYRFFVNFFDGQKRQILLDGRYENYLSGASLLADDGSLAGLAYVDGSRVKALPSNFIQDFLDRYLK